MEHRLVEELEDEVESLLASLIRSEFAEKLPVKPSPELLHLMAKAAVTAYEAAYWGTMRDAQASSPDAPRRARPPRRRPPRPPHPPRP